jgi:proline iminopeptidase
MAGSQLVDLPGGRRASYRVVGAGDPLLWLEGGPGFPAQLGIPDCELIAHRFRCHLVDAPGLGQTTDEPAWYRLEGVVEFFDEVRRALDVESWTLMGHSWGGLVALAYALAVPDAIDRIIVVDGYAGDGSVPASVAEAESNLALAPHEGQEWLEAATAPWLQATEQTTSADLTADMWPRWPVYFAHPDAPAQREHIARLRRDTIVATGISRAWDQHDYAVGIDLTHRLDQISCPALVLVGRHDWVCGPVWAQVIADHIPDARLHIFEDSGHIPQYEEPESFVAVIDEWLAEADRTEASEPQHRTPTAPP